MTITDSRPRHMYRLPDGRQVPIIFDHGEAPPTTSTFTLEGGQVVAMTLVATADNLTDEQIISLRDSPAGIESDSLRALCTVALQHGAPMGVHPWCRVCGWRKGGRSSWDGKACKCRLRAPEYHRCSTCSGLGTVPCDVGTRPCQSCDGSGLIDPVESVIARRQIADAINARAKAVR